jgi:hypothetical protein
VTSSKTLICLSLLLLLLACSRQFTGQAMNCRQIFEEPLRSLAFDELNSDTLPGWVADSYGLDASAVSVFDSVSDPDLTMTWSHEGKSYEAALPNGELLEVWMWWDASRPTGQEILECFGEPEYYLARDHVAETEELLLELWYPDQGLLINAALFGNEAIQPPLHENIKMTSVVVVRPGAIHDVVDDLYYSRSEEDRAQILESLKPWPQSWEEIEVISLE